MKKRLFYAAGFFTLLFSTHCFGRTWAAKANIPFHFQVGRASMPAGEYRISQSESTLTFKGLDGRPTATVLSRSTSSTENLHIPSLEFHRYGNQYFLAHIWLSGSQGVVVPKSKREKELAHELK
jgi:hypothetical protein